MPSRATASKICCPTNVQMVHGPGCPVCVLPIGRIDDAIALAMRPEVTLCTYADLMRVPASGGANLLKAKAAGADIRMVYSTLDAIRIAETEPDRRSRVLRDRVRNDHAAHGTRDQTGAQEAPREFQRVLQSRPDAAGDPGHPRYARYRAAVRVDGFVGPAHVSTVTGTTPYVSLAAEFEKPVVVAGFEPLDVVQAILMLVRQVNEGRHEVENQYIRLVTAQGNQIAQREMADVFELRPSFEWRGLGELPLSALRLRDAYADLDAERRFAIETVAAADNPACECGDVLRGLKKPADCKLFGTLCSPETPMGSCMVSPEGACAAHWTYGRFRDRARAGTSQTVV